MGIFDHIQGEIEGREKHEGGITPADLLDLSPPLRQLMRYITREGEIGVETAAEHLGESPENAREMLNALVEKGYLEREEREEGWVYRTHFARKRGRQIPPGIWSALGQRTKEE
jgi:DNA-binding MarR family transcriptional regulator